jgi:outer membrane protein
MLKKQICAALVAGAISIPAMADSLGVYAGVDYRTIDTQHTENDYSVEYKDNNNFAGYLAVEHFIPLIPNAKIKYADLSSDTDSGEIDSSATSAILYYGLFDNDLFELDLGVAYTAVETDYNDLSSDLGQGYAAAKLHVPGVGMHAFAEVVAGSLSSDDASDAEMGVAYTFNPDSMLLNYSVRAGYRYQDATIDNFKQENKGLFAGMEVHF